jgi:hypothetical protein
MAGNLQVHFGSFAISGFDERIGDLYVWPCNIGPQLNGGVEMLDGK